MKRFCFLLLCVLLLLLLLFVFGFQCLIFMATFHVFRRYENKLINTIVGSQDVAHDYDILMAHKITHIVNCATGVENIFLGAIKYLTLDILDLPWTNIEMHFDKCHEFMKEAVEGGGNVSYCISFMTEVSN